MKTGIYEIEHEEYLKKHGLSCSGLKNFAKSPADYIYKLQNPKPPTPAMLLGTHIHMAVLEPARHRDQYVVAPNVDRRTKKGKSDWAYFVENNDGKTVVTQDEMDTVNGVLKSIKNNETAKQYLKGEIEKSIAWTEYNGVLCKARPDVLLEKQNLIVDLKTTQDASPGAFQRTVANYKYHWQAAFYLRGMQEVQPDSYHGFVFVVVETSPPYDVATYQIDPEDIAIAEAEFLPLIDDYMTCSTFDDWPGLPDQLGYISLPNWYRQKVMMDNTPF